jgi:hypothetical protein
MVRTSMFMALQVELREEARGTDNDERRSGGVSPEVRSEPVEGGSGEVVRDDEGIRVDKLRVLLQNIRNVLNNPTQQKRPSAIVISSFRCRLLCR